MKKFMTVVALSCLSFGLANSTEKKSKDESVCRVTCSVTLDGITYTTSAGSIFRSCEGAADRCLWKLASAVM